MLTPKKIGKKIKLLRESKGWSQEELAKKMKYSRGTITHIEAGKRDLEALELVKFAEIFFIDPSEFLRDEEPAQGGKIKNIKKTKNKLKPEKLKNLILYILQKCGGKPNVGETVLYKLLYFSDFNNYEINGKPISGMNYIKLQFGPVPCAKEYSSAIKEMEAGNQIKIITQEYHGMIQKRYIAMADFDKSILEAEEKEIINEVISKYSDLNARQIEKLAHGDAPWKETANKSIIDYNLVFHRVPPYTLTDYEQEFVQAGANDVLKELGDMPDEEAEYYENL